METITPARAAQLLLNVGDNHGRMLPAKDRRYIAGLATEMRLGRWRFSGDAIVLGANLVVLNGVHRLQAVVDSGTTQEFVVVYLPECHSVRDVPDAAVPRTRVFQYGIPVTLGRVARLTIQLITARDAVLQPVSQYEAFIAEALPMLQRLEVPERGRFARSAPVLLAGMLWTTRSPESAEFFNEMLRAITANDPKKLTPLMYSLWRQWEDGNLPKGIALVARIWRAFDPNNQQTTKLQIQNLNRAIEELKDEIIATFPRTFATS